MTDDERLAEIRSEFASFLKGSGSFPREDVRFLLAVIDRQQEAHARLLAAVEAGCTCHRQTSGYICTPHRELEKLVGIRYRAFGSIEGGVELVSIRRGSRRFNITEGRTRKSVKCNLPEELEADAIEAMRFRHRVVVTGIIAYNGKDEPISLDVKKALRFLGNDLPRSVDLAGSDPDITGSMSTEDTFLASRQYFADLIEFGGKAKKEEPMPTTITEALAEVKTISARIQKRQEAALRYLARDARLRDPLENEGGSVEFVRRERQAVGDLEERLVRIRTAIQVANQTVNLTVGTRTRTVAEWLNWRREVSAGHKGFLGQLAATMTQARAQAQKQGTRVTGEADAKPGDFIIALSETELSREIEEIETILGELDGKLSLMNATHQIDL